MTSLNSLKSLFGDDQAAYEQFVAADVAKATAFARQQLQYHDALNELSANEVEPTEIVDEAVARLLTEKRGTKLALGKKLQGLIAEVVHEFVHQQEERERREVSLEGNVKDPIEESGFRTLGEHVLDFWQPDQDASIYEYIADPDVPTPAEIKDMKDREAAIYAGLNKLEKNPRENFVLMAVSGWTPKEVADWRGTKEAAIKDELRDTQSALRAALRSAGELENRAPRQTPDLPKHD